MKKGLEPGKQKNKLTDRELKHLIKKVQNKDVAALKKLLKQFEGLIVKQAATYKFLLQEESIIDLKRQGESLFYEVLLKYDESKNIGAAAFIALYFRKTFRSFIFNRLRSDNKVTKFKKALLTHQKNNITTDFNVRIIIDDVKTILKSEKERQIFDFYFIQGYTQQEIAEKFLVTQSMICREIKQIREKLRENLNERDYY